MKDTLKRFLNGEAVGVAMCLLIAQLSIDLDSLTVEQIDKANNRFGYFLWIQENEGKRKINMNKVPTNNANLESAFQQAYFDCNTKRKTLNLPEVGLDREKFNFG